MNQMLAEAAYVMCLWIHFSISFSAWYYSGSINNGMDYVIMVRLTFQFWEFYISQKSAGWSVMTEKGENLKCFIFYS